MDQLNREQKSWKYGGGLCFVILFLFWPERDCCFLDEMVYVGEAYIHSR